MRRVLAILMIGLTALPAGAWNARGHRLITQLALEGLPAEAPAWLRDPTTRDRIAFESSEVDRWRGFNSRYLHHENKPDHFLDIEDLDAFGLTIETIPPLRAEYLRALVIAKHVHPERAPEYDPAKDADRTKEWPGFLPHAIAEHYAKLQAAFHQVRILEKLDDSGRAYQLQQARENAIYHMGMLSHFVGDAAQPLHTTKHFNGWVGDNPDNYTRSDKFHAYIDGGVLARHKLTPATVKPAVKYAVKLNARDPWEDTIAYIARSHTRMVRVYQLEKTSELDQKPGKEFITECLADASAQLSAMYWAAWQSAAPNEKQVADFVFFDERQPDAAPDSAETRPAGQ